MIWGCCGWLPGCCYLLSKLFRIFFNVLLSCSECLLGGCLLAKIKRAHCEVTNIMLVPQIPPLVVYGIFVCLLYCPV